MVALLLYAWLHWHAAESRSDRSSDIIVVLVTSDPTDAVTRGARMGAEEMLRTTTLLGRRFVLREITFNNAGPVQTVGTSFFLLDVAEDQACGIAKQLTSSHGPVAFNSRTHDTACPAPMLSLRLPVSRRRALLEGIPRERSSTLHVDEWHASLQRFGAQELNKRYERRTHAQMDGDAWAGWFAMKVAADAALRIGSVTRQALIGPSAPAFDGHKGVPLRFDPSGVLEQPVYVIESPAGTPGKVVKEVS